MPIYEYRCTNCGHQLEALQKISDAALVDCPHCHENSLQKLVSASSFRLKGGGWYETDFKTGNKKQLADSDTAPKTGGDSSAKVSNKSAQDNKSSSDKASTSKSTGTTASKTGTKPADAK